MRNTIFIIIAFGLLSGCEKNIKSTKSNLFDIKLPDLKYFNANNVLFDKTVTLIHKKDTLELFKYDSLGRFSSYNYTRMWSRKESINYFDKTQFPIFKHIRVDYTLSFLGSLVKESPDTVRTFWYHEFGDVIDTFQYVYKDNLIRKIQSNSLNDYEKHKLERIFIYDNGNLIKIKANTIWGNKSGFGKLDSIIVNYTYNDKIISNINEHFYFKDKSNNHSNFYFFNDKGYPNKVIYRDTMNIDISVQK